MQLRFLGTSYSTTSITAETSELGIPGKYRGNTVSFRQAHHKDLHSAIALRYRGAPYLR